MVALDMRSSWRKAASRRALLRPSCRSSCAPAVDSTSHTACGGARWKACWLGSGWGLREQSPKAC